MNIWIFNHYAIAPGHPGGTRHFDLARELTKLGCKVTIFASSFQHQSTEDLIIPDRKPKVKVEEYDSVRFVWLKTNKYAKNDWRRILNMLTYTFRVYRTSLRLYEKPDIVIGSLMHPLAAWIAQKIAKKKGSIFYFEERDLWPQTLVDFGTLSERHPVVKVLSALELSLYKKATRIILLFDKAIHYVEKRGIETSKVYYLPNGVNMDRFNEPYAKLPEAFEEMLSALNGKFIIAYTGSHGISDQLDAVLETASLLNEQEDIAFVLVGNGPEKGRLMHKSEEMKLRNVIFLPPIQKEYIPAFLKRADAGVISLKDAEVYRWGMSFNKQHEYMASFLPILLLSKSDNISFEKMGVGIDAKTPQDLSDKILFLYKNPHVKEQIARYARHFVEKNHSWEQMAANLYETMRKDVHQEKASIEWGYEG